MTRLKNSNGLSRVERREMKLAKTCGLLSVVGLLPYLRFDGASATIISLALIGIAIAALHDVGSSRRPGGNLWTRLKTPFYSHPKADRLQIKNAFFNVINGGGAVVDEIDKYLNREAPSQ